MQDDLVFARRALRNGALGYVVKEAAGEELVEAVRAAASGWTYLHPALGARLATEAAAHRAPADQLTDRELDVLRRIALGHTNVRPHGREGRMYVLKRRPSVWSAFHVISTVFDCTVVEGTAGYDAQAINLAPSQGGWVEFTLERGGHLPVRQPPLRRHGQGLARFLATPNAPEAAGHGSSKRRRRSAAGRSPRAPSWPRATTSPRVRARPSRRSSGPGDYELVGFLGDHYMAGQKLPFKVE